MSTTKTSAQVPKLRFPGFEGEWCCDATTGSLCELIVDCVNKTAPVVEETTPFKMLRTTNIRNGKIDSFNCRRVTQETFETWTRRAKIERGDVILTREAPIGEVGYVDFDDTVFLGQRLMQYRVNPSKLDPRYLFCAFLSPSLRDQFAAHDGTGSTVSHIRVGDCSKFIVAHPTLPEQQKIAAFLTAVDGRNEQLSRKKALLEEYKKGVMQQLFTQTLRFQDDHGHDFPDWEEKKLSEIASIFDGTHSTPEYTKTGIPFYSVEHVTNGQYTKTKFISEEVFEKENKRVRLERGDILMTRIGDIGTSVHINWDVKASFYVSLALIKPRKALAVSEYVHQAIGSRDFQRELWQRTIHSAFPIKINLGEIGECKLRLPSLPEQTKIAGFLSALDGKIGAVGEQMRQTQAWKKGLLQQMFV